MVVSRFQPSPIVMSLLPRLAPSRPFVVYCQYKEVSPLLIPFRNLFWALAKRSRKFSTCDNLRLYLTYMYLWRLAMRCIHFDQAQIFMWVNASFSLSVHPMQVDASWSQCCFPYLRLFCIYLQVCLAIASHASLRVPPLRSSAWETILATHRHSVSCIASPLGQGFILIIFVTF